MKLQGLKINFLGDSITFGHGTSDEKYTFVNRLKETYNLAKAGNYGVSGTRIARQKDDKEFPEFSETFITRAKRMDEDADIIFVFGGTNDFGHGDAEFGSMADRTDETFCGACHVLFRLLIEKYPDSQIVIATPLHRLGEENPYGNGSKKQEAKPLEDYVTAIKTIAAYYAIPVLDLYAVSGLTPVVPALMERYMPDGLHPNDAGHERLARCIGAYLERL